MFYLLFKVLFIVFFFCVACCRHCIPEFSGHPVLWTLQHAHPYKQTWLWLPEGPARSRWLMDVFSDLDCTTSPWLEQLWNWRGRHQLFSQMDVCITTVNVLHHLSIRVLLSYPSNGHDVLLCPPLLCCQAGKFAIGQVWNCILPKTETHKKVSSVAWLFH